MLIINNQGNFFSRFLSFFHMSRSNSISNVPSGIANNETGVNVAQQNSKSNTNHNTTRKLNPEELKYKQKTTVPKMAECCHVTICTRGDSEFICPGNDCEKRYDNCREVSCLPTCKENVFTCHHTIKGIGWIDSYKCEGTRDNCEGQNIECECGWKGKEEIKVEGNTKSIAVNKQDIHISAANKPNSSNSTANNKTLIHMKRGVAIGGGISIG